MVFTFISQIFVSFVIAKGIVSCRMNLNLTFSGWIFRIFIVVNYDEYMKSLTIFNQSRDPSLPVGWT